MDKEALPLSKARTTSALVKEGFEAIVSSSYSTALWSEGSVQGGQSLGNLGTEQRLETSAPAKQHHGTN